MTKTAARTAVPAALVTKLRAICMGLPEVHEEQAWTGTRWSIRGKNFAHLVMIDHGWPPAYAQAAGTSGPQCVLTFRSPLPALDLHAFSWEPFFKPPWFPDIVGMRIGDETDWDEVAGLVRASYRHLVGRRGL